MILYVVQLRVAGMHSDHDELDHFLDIDLANKKFDEGLNGDPPADGGGLTLTTITFKDGVGVNVLAKDGGIFRWAESSDGEEWDQGSHEEDDG